MHEQALLQAMDVSKRYEDGTLALDHLNLSIHPGEIYALLGANGAGKTTTINLFLNYITPTTGTCFINTIDVVKDPLESKKYVSYVAENVMLYANFSARQNLDFFAKLAGKPGSTTEYYSIMRRVLLQENAFEQKVKKYSKGMRQKLGLAIAIIKNAPTMLLDEPTSGLDPVAANECMDILAALRKEGKAILMSTHDIFRAKQIADRIGIMKDGRLLLERTKDQLAQENLESLYINYMGTDLTYIG